MCRVVELDAGDSLEASERSRAARAAAEGDASVGMALLDLAGACQAVETALGSELGPGCARDVRAYLEPLDYLVAVTRVEGNVVRPESILVVD